MNRMMLATNHIVGHGVPPVEFHHAGEVRALCLKGAHPHCHGVPPVEFHHAGEVRALCLKQAHPSVSASSWLASRGNKRLQATGSNDS
ncbi:hypothetical protein PoB_007133600 [Plakobranchus ocellatus]|uniref:Uncharacterized protein n=1 Tax=Plakobranchus ocellatus TaxID=259542 RepID=A0AAV4DLH8_9GAST|nr:hypothetical protein PoB_007133600 [Plakobranchus ocellatus]